MGAASSAGGAAPRSGPFLAEGGADEVCGFLRWQGDAAMLVMVAPLSGRWDIRGAPPAATLPAPWPLHGGQCRELLTGREVELGAKLNAKTLFGEVPAAVFVRTE